MRLSLLAVLGLSLATFATPTELEQRGLKACRDRADRSGTPCQFKDDATAVRAIMNWCFKNQGRIVAQGTSYWEHLDNEYYDHLGHRVRFWGNYRVDRHGPIKIEWKECMGTMMEIMNACVRCGGWFNNKWGTVSYFLLWYRLFKSGLAD
ncbi:hypothetical protein BDV95DRAFT_604381 [Massariosphaeria phaeospora]|uniref:Uncharacterized protein n=1 Tax=Massariosphaeria phaeospora TaxID=100035 RepID=A0A7C8MT00_9PLEO|nr:hypothetical protein BDV95DRAFT_604381 [Massariosphaeria phaeospora]